MATAPPGRAPGQQDAVCYNCGSGGHWMVACPEPTRDVPAGLKRWQSQHRDQVQASEKHNSGPDRRGPIVTRYPPLPPHGSAPPRYGAPQPPVPPVYGPSGLPPTPPPFSGPYHQPAPYGPPYPPPPPQPQYGQFPPGPPPLPPPPFTHHSPPPYGQPPPPPHYPPPGYYAPPPPASYAPNTYPLPPGPDPGFAPQPYATPIPPPPPNYQHAPPPTVLGAVFAPLPPKPPASVWTQPSQHVGSSQSSKPQNHRHRHQRHQNQRKSKSNSHDRKDQPHKKHSKSSTILSDHVILPSSPSKLDLGTTGDQTAEISSESPNVQLNDGDGAAVNEWSEELQHELELIFAEHKGGNADPVGIPLPLQYTDDPTIPPAYNAKCIKSTYFQEDNAEQFAISIQETRDWHFLQHDPIFKQYPGMVSKHFTNFKHAYLACEKPHRHPADLPIRLPPKFQVDRNIIKRQLSSQNFKSEREDRSNANASSAKNHCDRNSTFRHGNDNEHQASSNWMGKRQRDDHRGYDSRDAKRPKRSSSQRPVTPTRHRENSGSQISPAARSIVSSEAWSPQASESMNSDNDMVKKQQRRSDGYMGSRGAHSREEHGNGYSASKARHDSGYHSGQSQQDKNGHSKPLRRDDDAGRGAKTSLERRPQSRTLSPPPGRTSRASTADESPNRSRSRSRSRSSSQSRSRSCSPLTALEADLLGLSRPDKPKIKTASPKQPIKRKTKAVAAFSRRW